MIDYYFTFGTAHVHKDGYTMASYWVRVSVSTEEEDPYGAARSYFVEKFSSIYTGGPEKWSFQYSEKQFESSRHYYMRGEHTHLTKQ